MKARKPSICGEEDLFKATKTAIIRLSQLKKCPPCFMEADGYKISMPVTDGE